MPSDLRLNDREAIRDVLYQYCRAIDRRDFDLLVACYHTDSVDQHASFTGSGPDFCTYAMKTVAKAIVTQHCMSNVLIEFEGNRAFVESYVYALHRMDQQGKLVDFQHYGRYCDIFELREGTWKISYRLHVPDADHISEVEEPMGRSCRPQAQESGRFYVRGVAGPEDPSYRRFNISQLRCDVAPIHDMFEKHLSNRKP
jgi:3-phenylpropionate/cinnamic acid dioxygenase small subunit